MRASRIAVGAAIRRRTVFGYAYAEDAEKGSWIPDKSHKMDVQEYVIYASVGNATSVGVEIASSQYARLEDFTFHVNDANAHSNFKGCTETANGVRGFVPQPQAGDGEKFFIGKRRVGKGQNDHA